RGITPEMDAKRIKSPRKRTRKEKVEKYETIKKQKGQEFEDLPLEHDIHSFIRDLGHSGDIIYLIDLSVDYLHQPWRAFATIINKCLSGKETRMDKIRLSHAQILWDGLKRSRIPLVKVRWNFKRGPEFMWEREDQFRKKYPHLFAKTTSSSSVTS
nr:putative reverse transcriptase domain-containing protein [Tanacetum cinerariifolium]